MAACESTDMSIESSADEAVFVEALAIMAARVCCVIVCKSMEVKSRDALQESVMPEASPPCQLRSAAVSIYTAANIPLFTTSLDLISALDSFTNSGHRMIEVFRIALYRSRHFHPLRTFGSVVYQLIPGLYILLQQLLT